VRLLMSCNTARYRKSIATPSLKRRKTYSECNLFDRLGRTIAQAGTCQTKGNMGANFSCCNLGVSFLPQFSYRASFSINGENDGERGDVHAREEKLRQSDVSAPVCDPVQQRINVHVSSWVSSKHGRQYERGGQMG
jgi:hypothetical protein